MRIPIPGTPGSTGARSTANCLPRTRSRRSGPRTERVSGGAVFRLRPELPRDGRARRRRACRDRHPDEPLVELPLHAFARATFRLHGRALALDCLWLQGYGGGLFLPFGDATNGATTYGAGRYLLDTVKGADLGCEDRELVLDFNFAYNPSCVYNPRWVCPLAPAANRLPVPVEAGERAP